MGSPESMTILIKLAFTACVIVAILWYVVRPLFRTWQQHSELEAMMPTLFQEPEEELQIPTDPSDRKKPDRNQMLKELREDPTRTAMLLKQWIAEKEKGKGRKPRA